MKKIILNCLFIILISNISFAQELNKKFFDKRVGSEILIDDCDRSGLEEGKFGEIFANQYSNYKPDEAIINELKAQTEAITIKIVFGSWCHDSKMQVPKFYKVLDQIQFKDSKVAVIGVDRMKKTHEADISGMKIRFVPTFIIYKNGEEIGRIIESPKKTLEKDLLEILI
jgi:thiol-disulfide isomerase/thioredoxin